MKKYILLPGLFSLFFILNTNQLKAQYCAAAGNCSGFDQIINVALSNLSIASGPCAVYSDFTANGAANLYITYSSTLTVTRATPGGVNVFGAVWIDWNQNNVFEDPSEKVATFAGPGHYTQSITPAGGTPTGLTRMRIRLQGTTPPTSPCGTAGYEVEDYAINVLSGPPPPPPIAYCDARGLNDPTCSTPLNNWISNFNFQGTPFLTSCGLVNGYSDYTATIYNVLKGATYTANIMESPVAGSLYFSAEMWIDWNQDKDFTDPGEFIPCPNVGIATFNASILVPASASFGQTRMRVRARRHDVVGEVGSPCGTTTYGEVEDYTINVVNASTVPYCAASGDQGCVEVAANWIVNVNVGTINNSSACDAENNADGYSNFTSISTVMSIGQSYNLTFTSGPTTDPVDAGGAWIDWNGDGVFNAAPDAEALIVVPNTATGVYTVANIVPPAGSMLGTTRMRVRLRWTGTVGEFTDPCGDTQYGEVEDYSIVVSASLPLKLLSFDASVINRSFARLTWVSESEDNFRRYEIERSNTGNNWQTAGFVDARGGPGRQTYQWTDPQYLKGVFQYRLKMLHPAGNLTYSHTRSVKIDGDASMTVSPNPAKEMVTISLHTGEKDVAQVQLVNVNGSIVYTRKVAVTEGNNSIEIPLQPGWPAGFYMIRVLTGSGIYISKLEVVK